MVSVLPTQILLLFLGCLAAAFFVPFFSDASSRRIKPAFDAASVKFFAFFILPFVLLFCAGWFFDHVIIGGLMYFAVAAILPFVLSRFNFTARHSGIILLLLSFLTTMSAGSAVAPPVDPLVCILSGLLVFKTVDILFFAGSASVEDVLPAAIWLGGAYWVHTAGYSDSGKTQLGLLAATLAVSQLMRVLQGPFLADDKVYLKRIMLSATGGLFLLIAINKLLLAISMAPMAALFAAGLFMAYLIEGSAALPASKNSAAAAEAGSAGGPPASAAPGRELGAAEAVKYLILVGILTLIATRFFGTMGLLVLAPSTLVAVRSPIPMQAGLFWLARALLQAFIITYNPNVTGINLTHAYTSAGLYAGMLAALLVSMLLRDNKQRWVTTSVLLGAATVLPIASNYLLHEEPTGSLLVSVTVASLLLAFCAPALYSRPVPANAAMMLLPPIMIAAALLSGQLISAGNEATIADRATYLAYGAALFMVASLAAWWFTAGSRRKPVEVSGNQD